MYNTWQTLGSESFIIFECTKTLSNYFCCTQRINLASIKNMSISTFSRYYYWWLLSNIDNWFWHDPQTIWKLRQSRENLLVSPSCGWMRYHGGRGVSMCLYILLGTYNHVQSCEDERRDKTRRDYTKRDETRRDVKEKEGERTRIAGGVLLGYWSVTVGGAR